jgi:hypothetical protein
LADLDRSAEFQFHFCSVIRKAVIEFVIIPPEQDQSEVYVWKINSRKASSTGQILSSVPEERSSNEQQVFERVGSFDLDTTGVPELEAYLQLLQAINGSENQTLNLV